MIYVLLLQENKIYVGFTERPVDERFIEHFNYSGSRWTTVYRPLQVLQIEQGGLEEENEMTLRMMDRYGWWNVRGGNWCRVEMNSCPAALLEWQRLRVPALVENQHRNNSSRTTATRGCGRCGRDSHSINNCYARVAVDGQALESSSSESDFEPSFTDRFACYRCGRSNHFASSCYAKTTIDGFGI
jgi:hypothetical protein